MTTAPLLQQLQTELAIDPYRFDLVIEQLLYSSVIGSTLHQHQATQVLNRLPDSLQFGVMAKKLQQKELQILDCDRFYLLAPAGIPLSTLDGLQQQIDATLDFLLRLEPAGLTDLLVIQLVPAIFSLLDQRLQGVAYVQIEFNPQHAELAAARLAHELAHVVFPCRNRVLSEGIALYFEWLLQPQNALLSSPAEVKAEVAAYQGQKPSLALLLSAHFDQDLFFNQNTGSTAEQQLIYQAGYLLISQLVEDISLSAIPALLQQLADPAADVLQTYLSMVSPPAELLPEGVVIQLSATDVAEIELQLCRDRILRSQDAYLRYFAALSQSTDSFLENTAQHQLLLARLLLSKIYSDFHRQQQISELDCRQVEHYASQLEQLDHPAESAYLRARIALLYAFHSADFLEQAKWFEQVIQGYEAALDSAFVGSEAHLDYASFCLKMPVNTAENSARAAVMLDASSIHRRYQPEVQVIRQRYTEQLRSSHELVD
jgi:hypothetical protein